MHAYIHTISVYVYLNKLSCPSLKFPKEDKAKNIVKKIGKKSTVVLLPFFRVHVFGLSDV